MAEETSLDRDGNMLTHQEKSVLVLFPFLKNMDWKINKVAAIMGVPINDLKNQI